MSETTVYPISAAAASRANIGDAEYTDLYAQSINNPINFWREQAQRIDWIKPFSTVKNTSFERNNVNVKWYEDGTLNVCYNCVDRHLIDKANQTAIIFEGDEPDQQQYITYAELHKHVSRFANVLKAQGVKKGDVVTLYMPMIPEATYAMLACTRIGAVHSVVFGGFSPEALAGRIKDCQSTLVITADEGVRGGKTIPLKANVDQSLEKDGTQCVESVLVVSRTGGDIDWTQGRDYWYHDEIAAVSDDCPVEEMSAEDPLFVLYTSGSTGTPKGVLHTTGGYLVYASLTHEAVFDYQKGDIYWCTADVGWITGHSYIVYGPLANGATTVMFEGVPNYPSINRFAQVVDKHQVNVLYTAPTAIRSLMAQGTQAIEGTGRDSLRLLGSVGEPINPEAWEWYYEVMGNKRCPVVDTWWQTETGGIMISPLPGATALKPGSATRPFFGIQPALVDNEGVILEGEAEGNLVVLDSWPGQMRTVQGDHQRFMDTYFATFDGMYFTGDGARRDKDGYFWITGRVDDVLNVSGHRMGTAELESVMVAHDKVAEAAVVGYPHDIKGQGIYIYVTLNMNEVPDEALNADLKKWVRQEIGPIATPDIIQFSPGLPKTRSGKIMRRILRKIAAGEYDTLGDISTLADPSVVSDLIDVKESMKG